MPPKSLRTAKDLLNAGLISKSDIQNLSKVEEKYTISVSKNVAGNIMQHNHTDPVYRQYIPDIQELHPHHDDQPDPIGDSSHEVTKGLIHRYTNRVLFKITPICAVYCRFCFRREMVGHVEEALDEQDIEAAFSYINTHSEIEEVILSGGDPLILSARRLTEYIKQIEQIPHIHKIRIHSRIPVATPERITEDLTKSLTTLKPLRIVLHINHAQEITKPAVRSWKMLQDRNIQLLSQSVLLKGVNDSPEILANLFDSLHAANVTPYYLHHPDKAPGTAHFRINIKDGQAIYDKLCHTYPRSLPKYVLDIPGGYGKVPINNEWIAPASTGGYHVRDRQGRIHHYDDE